ncbi:hypothetical protein KOI35_32640 [Actinoplanes bogorensis]|uniref:Uncharacterized protein n=1 Tax=Paractinoplanes bogorensis TaxID=1610840 RepID=A0ABS5YYV4_9ACTN|nr:hypothetical protein [Actinoplanes bogorensis]MBU2668271.1 hypothetical protein [Actinoplanes bogorensis]
MINTASKDSRKLIYGHAQLHDCLAFADGETAAAEAQEIVAIASAKTYGEARAVRPQYVRDVVPGLGEDHVDGDHADDEPFDINELTSVIEGDWPPMVTSRAFDLLPTELQEQFGNSEFTAMNGDLLEVPVSAEAELVAALRERGFEVTRDDELINTLDGRSFSPLD